MPCCDYATAGDSTCDDCRRLFINRVARTLKREVVYLVLDTEMLKKTNKPSWAIKQITRSHPRLNEIRETVKRVAIEK